MSTATGASAAFGAPPVMGSSAVTVGRKQHARKKMDSRQKGRRGKIAKKSREWIALKKEAARRQGKEVAHEKYGCEPLAQARRAGASSVRVSLEL